ncbi:MAG TPA: isopentenyl phosphate kinase [Cyclobacteriaceae bacterium]|jgi:isopentenyl phosphate kinase|nr:isopentenyl phosphate kinase [Cyclobacteriaceae bacterium]
MNTILIKIGGSVITRQGKDPINLTAIKRLARQLRSHKERIILVHGTGHIGKPPALKYGYTETQILSSTESLTALQIRNSIQKLTMCVSNTLINFGIPAIAIDNTHFFGYFAKTRSEDRVADLIKSFTENKIVPVFGGNFLPLQNGGYRVLSSDEVTFAIARLVRPERVIFLSNVDGVLDANNQPVPVFKKDMLKMIQDNENDVSGGMKTKVKTALKLKDYCAACYILNGTRKDILRQALQGVCDSGTRISFS